MLMVHDEEKACLRPVRLRERVVPLQIARGDMARIGEPATVITRTREGVRVQFDDLSIALSFDVRLATADDELARAEPVKLAA